MASIRSMIEPTLTLDKIRFQSEGQYFDRKSARLEPRDLAHIISAFANASGGVVALGVEDDGEISGVNTSQENLFRKAAIDFLQYIPEQKIEIIDDGNNVRILLIHISPSVGEIIKCKNGDAYLRVGDSSRKLSVEQLMTLEYSKGVRSFENRIIDDATWEDLDETLLEEYRSVLGPSVGTAQELLIARGLIKMQGNKPQITVAGVLLFGKIPTKFLPTARIRFLRYEGTSIEVGRNFNVVKDITIEKPLHRLLSEAQQVLSSQMREFQQLDRDGKFKKIPEYPEFAWLEGIVNAVTHRDYSISGEYIRISMFNDRIEILSPGKLPNIVTVKNIQNTRFSRNPLLARVLADFGWVRELNEGVKRIYTDMESFFLEPPIFNEPNGNTVQLTLKNNIAMRSIRKLESLQSINPITWSQLNPLDRDIIYYIANMEECSTAMLERLTKKSRPTIIRHLKALSVENGGPIEEHSSSAHDPTKYYTIR